VVHPKH